MNEKDGERRRRFAITYSFTLKGCLQCSCPFPHTRPARALLYSVSAHCSNPHSTFRDKIHSKPRMHRLCSLLHFNLTVRRDSYFCCILYVHLYCTLHMLVHTHTPSALLVLLTWCLIYQPCVCIVLCVNCAYYS